VTERSRDAIWADFNLEQNCVQVSDVNQVRLYFAQFALALRCLDRLFEKSAGASNHEARAIDRVIGRLTDTFRLLGLKYFYPTPSDTLKIDATDSGFFHFSSLIELEADLRGRVESLAKLEPLHQLKQELADRVVRHQAPVRDLQEKIARRLFHEQLAPEKIFSPFLCGELSATAATDEGNTYFWWFATYDKALNRPFLYMLYFVYDKDEPLTDESMDFAQLVEEARGHASGKLNLLAFSHMLDDALPKISPRIVKRVILGPWWAPQFTVNEGELGKLLDEARQTLPFALKWETETLISDREVRVGKSLISRGKLKQVFWIPGDVDLAARGVSHLARFVLVPHGLAQHMAERDVLADHSRYVIDQDDEVHGVH
jgi:hypothetical protein